MAEPIKATTTAQNTIRIGGIKFNQDEVQGVNKEQILDNNGNVKYNVFTVQTNFGRFEYYDTAVHNRFGQPSILNGTINNVEIARYYGTNGQDNIKMNNSAVTAVYLGGDGNNDNVFADEHSIIHWSEQDKGDTIWTKGIGTSNWLKQKSDVEYP